MKPIHPSKRLWALVLVGGALVLAVDVAIARWPDARPLNVTISGDPADAPTEILLDSRRVEAFDAHGFALPRVRTGHHELQIARGPDCAIARCGEGRCPQWCVITTHPIDVSFGFAAESVTIELSKRAITTLERQRYSMLRIETGSFEVGSPPDEPLRSDDEVRSTATIEHPYALGATEVTQDLWTALMGTNPVVDAACGGTVGPKAPVVCVSQPEIDAFLTALSAQDGLDATHRYRLPSEVEWEFAARAWTTSAYGAVRDAAKLCKTANVDASVGCDDGFPETAPVASLLPNTWGLYDMLGNVAEVVAAEPGAAVVPVRGGSWKDGACCVRVAARTLQAPDLRDPHAGFRLARSLD